MVNTSGPVAHLLGLAAAFITFGVMCWDLGRPALWLDESASVMATQRTWPNLWLLLHGADAPLVPYYVVLKALSGLGVDVDPGLWHHPEVMYRWPSVIAVTLAVWVLTTWLARTQTPQLAFGTTSCLLMTGGLSRYGQEARPYAIVLMLAVVSTAIWAKLVSNREWGWRAGLWTAGYAPTIALISVVHPLAASLLVAHLVAALVAPARGRRWRTFSRTLLGGAVGLLAVLHIVLTVTTNGRGATAWPTLTAGHLWLAFLRLFTYSTDPWLGVGPLLLLAVIGMTRVVDRRYGFVARLALCWAALPPLVLLPAVFLRPNLLIGRYLLFIMPGWAILAGLGLATITEVTRRLTSRLIRRTLRTQTFSIWGPGNWSRRVPVPGLRSPLMHTGLSGRTGTLLDRIIDGVAHLLRPRTLRLRFRLAWTAWIVAAAIGAMVVGLTAYGQVTSLNFVRSPGGHGEDIRPVLDAANWPQFADLPIVSSSNLHAIEVPAYDRADDGRLAGNTAQRAGTQIWTAFDATLRRQVLDVSPRVVLLLHESAPAYIDPGCVSSTSVVPVSGYPPTYLLNPAAQVYRCMPTVLQRMNYRVVALEPGGFNWGFAVLDRAPLPGSATSAGAAAEPKAKHAAATAKRQLAQAKSELNPVSKKAAKLRVDRPGSE